jgi:hypothetical protein
MIALNDTQLREVEAIIARGDDHLDGDFAAAKLLRRMLKAGLSRYEPSPIAALERAKAKPEPKREPDPAV